MELPSPQGTPDKTQPLEIKPTFNVVIAYEDFATGRHARETYDYLARSLEQDLTLDSQMWKFDLLGNSELREMAVKDAADADLIMVSSRGNGDLPCEVKAWIEEWTNRLATAMALVKLTAGSQPALPGADIQRTYLHSVARRAGMDFFAQPDEWPDRSEEFTAQAISERAHATSTLMANFLAQSTTNWCWWNR